MILHGPFGLWWPRHLFGVHNQKEEMWWIEQENKHCERISGVSEIVSRQQDLVYLKYSQREFQVYLKYSQQATKVGPPKARCSVLCWASMGGTKAWKGRLSSWGIHGVFFIARHFYKRRDLQSSSYKKNCWEGLTSLVWSWAEHYQKVCRNSWSESPFMTSENHSHTNNNNNGQGVASFQ